MKVWMKLVIGAILGMILGFLLPQENQEIQAALEWLQQLAISIGRYTLLPTLVFALTIAVYELRQDKRMWGLIFKTVLVLAASTIFIIGSGMLVTMLFPPARIPILIEGQRESIQLDIGRGILEMFPSNMFSALTSSASYLVPACVFAFFLGAGLSYDRTYSKPVISLVDSLSRIFYYITIFFSEILGLTMILLGAFWAVRFHEALQAEVFMDILKLLGVYGVILSFVILPLFLYLLGPKINPWKQLYAVLAPALAGFFSGDINFTLPLMLRTARENHGVKRRSNTITLAIFGIFGRAGSAMVAAISLIVIIKSYSSLGVNAADLLKIGTQALLVSVLLGRHPGSGAYAALAVLCANYGRGFEAGYLILKPIAFYLVSIATLIDVVTASLASYAIGRWSEFQEDREARHFI